MAADSSMGFHQGITASMYNHHMLSFQSNTDVGIGGSVADGTVIAPRTVSETTGLFLSPNTGVISNASGVGPSRSSSEDVLHDTGSPKYKFVTCSPADWSDTELAILKEGLARYAREPNIMKYIKIAALLPKRTIRDVALRCWWNPGKERRKKPDGFYSGKKIRDMKPIQDKMVTSVPMANFHMAPTNSITPFSISMQQPNQHCQVPKGDTVVDSETQHLLEENNQLLNQIAANIETFKTEQNTDLFLRTSGNIKTILRRMSETPGIMGQMPSLPVPIKEDQLNSLVQLNRMVASYGATHNSHTKQEPRS
ncbi:hypothetical protein ACP4OV_026051 [Aristida adscensionis]